eukprot:TRINITY_DN4374_c0_g1_i1.p1 TRINITY_DN4374_c0_g1~~TRINITY_DN4374_c0_g1_i1.p1  ORF type:complete len:567 (-),score=99.35 TRINITY_DN4374_c0_g1_i1:7-1707(-)
MKPVIKENASKRAKQASEEQAPPELEQTCASQQWKHIGTAPRHGIVVPIWSLHSENSCGVGEFGDLADIVEWCPTVGFSIVQLLPLNDTFVSPYSALSAFAINPVFLSLARPGWLPLTSKILESADFTTKLSEFRSTCSSSGSGDSTRVSRLDYATVRHEKFKLLRLLFDHAKDAGDLDSHPQYQAFLTKHEQWLTPYAAFLVLRNLNNNMDWEQWPDMQLKPDIIPTLSAVDVEFFKFVQFLCHEQLCKVRAVADKSRVLMKGDVPILVSRDSADVWARPEMFDLNFSAGAPPDVYSADGQNWGFPPYRWDVLAKDSYKWWQDRLHYAADFYHLYRIDHIVGFYRLWHVPIGSKATQGHYEPADEKEWIPHGEKLMRMMINAAPTMLPIGEDLGTVPDSVRQNLRELGICGTKVIRWERRWAEDGQPFIPDNAYPMASMCTVSTHDSETLRQWWINAPQEAVQYAKLIELVDEDATSAPEWTPALHAELLRRAHHASSLFHINLLQEYFSAVQSDALRWPELDDERVNIPGVVWCWLFHEVSSMDDSGSFPFVALVMLIRCVYIL